VPFGLVLSLAFHAALLGWALFSMRSVPPLSPDTPAISADIITPSDFLRLKQGSEDAKNLETKAKDEPKPDDSKNDTAKPSNAPPPPPPPAEEEVAKAEPPPEAEPPAPAEPPKAAEQPKPAPDPIAKKIEEPPPPPPPEPAPGPTPDEKKLLEQKLEQEHQAEEAKKKAEEEAKQKADEEAKKKAEEEAKKAEEAAKKKAEEAAKKKRVAELKKKKREEAKKKAEAAKKKFDPSKIASLLAKSPDDSPPKALLDKDPRKKGQQASGSSATSDKFGKEAGTATGTDTVLSAREQDLLKGMLKSQLNGCWRPPGTGGGEEVPVVELHWEMGPDGALIGEPRVTSAPPTTAGQVYTEAAVRAVKMCSPFRLPPDKYDAWKIVDWTFDPRQML
jgi:colicin import membrane protein